MLNNELIHRIHRIYAAVGAAEEADISKFKSQVISDGRRIGFYQDWKGGLSDEELSNIAYSLIHNIANLLDHLKNWAKHNGQDDTKVDSTFDASEPLKIIQDLSNNDKHGYPPRDGGRSGKSPRIDKVTRLMQMTTAPEKGSFISLTFNRQGVPQIVGSGTAKVIITGDILDIDGNRMDDFHRVALQALDAWERLLCDFGIKL